MAEGRGSGCAPAIVLREWPETLAILPRHGGVTAGHVLIIPRVHVADVAEDPTAADGDQRREDTVPPRCPN